MDGFLPAAPSLAEKGARPVKMPASERISVIIPFHNASAYLEPCLLALGSSEHGNCELILVNDGSTDSSAEIARRHAQQFLTFPSPHGPAYARNRGAEIASGSILFFIDADVLCHPDTLSKLAESFAADPDLAAVIGSYDDTPAAANFLSRYKNLTHHYVHQNASRDASTFWTGCGAIRRDVFLKLGGFDESYRKPSIEDIELGCRMRAQRYRIALRKDLVVTHAKRWTLRSLLRSDILDRALPWTILQLRYRRIVNDLNLSWTQRSAALLTFLAVLFAAAGFRYPVLLAGAGAAFLVVATLNRSQYRFYYKHGGAWFCLCSVAMHWFYYLYSMAAFGAGCVQFLGGRKYARAGSGWTGETGTGHSHGIRSRLADLSGFADDVKGISGENHEQGQD